MSSGADAAIFITGALTAPFTRSAVCSRAEILNSEEYKLANQAWVHAARA